MRSERAAGARPGEVAFAFLSAHGVEAVERGPNVGRGNFNIKCPWCADDPSHHMGISFDTGYFYCWRNPEHKGRDVARVVAAATGLPYRDVRAALGLGAAPPPDPGELARVASVEWAADGETPASPKYVDLKRYGVMRLFGSGEATARHDAYLRRRGYRPEVANRYRMLACVAGKLKDRVLFTVRSRGGVRAFTARAVYDSMTPRYYASRDGTPLKSLLWNEERVRKAGRGAVRAVVAVEGPFDALRLDWAGRQIGVRAVALFGTATTLDQEYRLVRLARGLRAPLLIALDADAELKAARLAQATGGLVVPCTKDDFGEMTHAEAQEWCERYALKKAR